MVGASFQAAVVGGYGDGGGAPGSRATPLEGVPGPFRELDSLVAGLMAATPAANRTDSDNDTIYDGVERVIGTDPYRADSDFDLLTDMEEVANRTDPMAPDSNRDGILDVHEVRDNATDLDGDGAPNAWDADNDGDGLADSRDLCPFSRTPSRGSFHLDINTSGAPTTVHFQIRTADPTHMRLVTQSWDWPADGAGMMRDLDGSEADVVLVPVLELSGPGLPDDPALAGFGVVVSGDRAFLSLTPLWELGDVVALQGQMYYPPSAGGRNISVDAELVWRVSGRSDRAMSAYRVDGGGYLSVTGSGAVTADGDGASDGSLFEEVDLDGGRIALKASIGAYLCVGADGSVRASSARVQDSGVLAWSRAGGRALLASNGLHLRSSLGGPVMADAEEGSSFVPEPRGCRPESTILAAYGDEFALAGCAVEESRGTDLALLHRDDSAAKALAADLFLAYEFLRNGTNGAADIPGLLAGEGLDMDVLLGRYNRTDEAVADMAGRLLGDVRGGLPEGAPLPVITAMQMRTVYADMSHMGGGACVLEGALAADLTAMPVIDRRLMRTDWFERGGEGTVGIQDVLEEMAAWDLPADDLSALMSLVVAWNRGEERVAGYGGRTASVAVPEWVSMLGIVKLVVQAGLTGWDSLGKVAFGTKVVASYVYLLAFNIPTILETLLREGAMWGGSKAVVSCVMSAFEVVEQVGSLETGIMGAVNAFGKVMSYLGLVTGAVSMLMDLALTPFTCYAIGTAWGWSTVGTFAAVLTTVLTATWAVYSFLVFGVLAMVPYVGWAIGLLGLLVTLIDYLGYLLPFIGNSLVAWTIEAIVDDLTARWPISFVDLVIDATHFTVEDEDGNGIDVGDRFTYKSFVQEAAKLWSSDEGDFSTVQASHINYSVVVSVPHRSRSNVSSTREVLSTVERPPMYAGRLVEVTGWAEPGIAMVNYPFTYGFEADYTVIYREGVHFFGWHTEDRPVSGKVTTYLETLRFDVMPGTLDEFVGWREIRALDRDGDGINDTAETSSSSARWDTDGDGLGDMLELQLGSNPWREDTDADGMNDFDEHDRGCDVNDADTDGDGITDGIEHAGWVVTFVYEGTEFDWQIDSSPTLNDTDGDGLDDHLEYLTLQNPRSRDTDGDGVKDALRDYTVTEFSLKRALQAESSEVIDVVVDEEGYIYATAGMYGAGRVYKYAPNGTRVGEWDLGGMLYTPGGIALDGDGALWICNSGDPDHAVVICDRNGTVTGTWAEDTANSRLASPSHLAFDGEGRVYVSCRGTDSVEVYSPNGTFLRGWGGPGSGEGQFYWPSGVAVDDEGYVYVVDFSSARVEKFDPDGTFVRQWGSPGTAPGQLVDPVDIAVDRNGDVLVGSTNPDAGNSRLHKFDSNGRLIAEVESDISGGGLFIIPIGLGLTDGTVMVADEVLNGVCELWHNVTLVPAEPVNVFPDTDGDGLLDDVEATGWAIDITDIVGPRSVSVTSDPLLQDTDGDTLNDTVEFQMGSDPRSVDTDGDGVPDQEEARTGTNVSNWDTDGDGLDDGTERTFGSDPLLQDTDGEGLTDDEEFRSWSDPNAADTDADGLDDADEDAFGSSPLDPDSDDDLMLDSREQDVGTRPDVEDFDGDGLIDGYEDVYETDATDGDSDGDALPDGLEVSMRIDPLSNDTDGDGLSDSAEVDAGLNPRSADSDGDGVPDGLDTDYEVPLEGTIYAVVDASNDTSGLVARLSAMADVVVVTSGELLSEHSDARYVVIIGDPGNGEGTAGSLIGDLLQDCPDILEGMNASGAGHIAVRYGRWAPVQTIVMLSRTYPSDHYRVLGILRSVAVKVTERALSFDFLAPRSWFVLDDIDTLLATGARVWAELDEMAVFGVDIARYTEDDVPWRLAGDSGLAGGEVAVDRYLGIEVRGGLQGENGDLVAGASIWLYYALDDLDRTGDGDADDPEDIDEASLALYALDEGTGNWTRLSTDLDWVNGTDVNTTDVVLHGRPYAGSVWAEVTHLSTFGIAGRHRSGILATARPGPDISAVAGREVTFDGTASIGNGGIANYTWRLDPGTGPVVLYGPAPTYVFEDAGEYVVRLTVTDSIGATDEAAFNVTVRSVEDEDGLPAWVLILVLVLLLVELIALLARKRGRPSPAAKAEGGEAAAADTPAPAHDAGEGTAKGTGEEAGTTGGA